MGPNYFRRCISRLEIGVDRVLNYAKSSRNKFLGTRSEDLGIYLVFKCTFNYWLNIPFYDWNVLLGSVWNEVIGENHRFVWPPLRLLSNFQSYTVRWEEQSYRERGLLHLFYLFCVVFVERECFSRDWYYSNYLSADVGMKLWNCETENLSEY